MKTRASAQTVRHLSVIQCHPRPCPLTILAAFPLCADLWAPARRTLVHPTPQWFSAGKASDLVSVQHTCRQSRQRTAFVEKSTHTNVD